MKEEVINRVNEVLRYYNLSANEMSKEMDISSPNAYGYLSGKRQPPISFLIKFLEVYPDVSAEWLLRGDGKMLIRDEKQRSYIERAAQEAGMQYAAEEELDKDEVFSKLFDVVTHRLDEQAQKVHELAKQLDDMKSILYK